MKVHFDAGQAFALASCDSLRRQLVAMDGTPKELLSRGQQKSIQTDRVVLVLGPTEELKVVREMFGVFTRGEQTEAQIAQSLSDRGLLTGLGRAWTWARTSTIADPLS
jgi:hypothetical protein